ncbi:MAG: PfkB family carbohydrate kinase [Actinomycetaceae bacterium]|nr:PfkB family carbohydrate kinase [Actinomycetaceae bacterium]MDU0970826.1 PfkB family carbohydrate kinase [Actinomycetaceae bacterium]
MIIACAGQAVVDLAVTYPGTLVENQKYQAKPLPETAGGPAMTASCALATWGAQAVLVTHVGDDPRGHMVRDVARSHGVDTSQVMSPEGARTGYSLIAVNEDTGARTVFNVPPLKGQGSPRYSGPAPDVILADGHELDATMQLIADYPHAAGVVDAGTCRESTLEVARAVDHLVCSQDFAAQYTGRPIPPLDDAAAVDALVCDIEGINGARAVITLGERGVLFRDEDGRARHLPAYPVTAVDTTGAGDIFHAGYAWGVARGLGLLDTLRLASWAAACSVQRPGGLRSVPSARLMAQVPPLDAD